MGDWRPQRRTSKRVVYRRLLRAYVERAEDDARRVREGDLDHLVFYALQSTHFTRLARSSRR